MEMLVEDFKDAINNILDFCDDTDRVWFEVEGDSVFLKTSSVGEISFKIKETEEE